MSLCLIDKTCASSFRPPSQTPSGATRSPSRSRQSKSCPEVRRFSFAELTIATSQWSRCIGKGGFGEVFSGHLPDGTPIAVKRAFNKSGAIDVLVREAEMMDSLAKEVSGNSRLLPLLGVCLDSKLQPCLVMPLKAGGSLARHIGRSSGKLVTGPLRVAVALDAARGVAALHAHQPFLLHRDITPGNILLDDDLQHAYVADYGLSRVLIETASILHGTQGYHAPETLASGIYSGEVRSWVSQALTFGLMPLAMPESVNPKVC